MKVGTLCYATEQGLGILAKQFYDNGIITHPFIVEHAHHKNNYEWYPDVTPRTHIRKFDHARVERFCKTMDIMLFFETPFDWNLIRACDSMGVKTVLMPMYECMPKTFPRPDLILNPSTLDQEYYPEGVYIPVPVAVKHKLRKKCEVFVHNAGHGGLKGRNGTAELIEAVHYITKPATIIVRSQNGLTWQNSWSSAKLKIQVGSVPYDTLYDTGDCFIFPEKFNGLSLPLQEAFASGMLVMGTNRKPMNEWLPNAPLIPPIGYTPGCISARCNDFFAADVKPETIAQWIDDWYGRDITEYSMLGEAYAQKNSWSVLKPRYLEVLENTLR